MYWYVEHQHRVPSSLTTDSRSSHPDGVPVECRHGYSGHTQLFAPDSQCRAYAWWRGGEERTIVDCRRNAVSGHGRFGKSKVTMHQTVTRLETTDPVERYLSEGISFQTPEGTTLNVANTSTLTVQQTDMLSSRLMFAVALDLPVGGSLQDFVLYYLCAPCLHR